MSEITNKTATHKRIIIKSKKTVAAKSKPDDPATATTSADAIVENPAEAASESETKPAANEDKSFPVATSPDAGSDETGKENKPSGSTETTKKITISGKHSPAKELSSVKKDSNHVSERMKEKPAKKSKTVPLLILFAFIAVGYFGVKKYLEHKERMNFALEKSNEAAGYLKKADILFAEDISNFEEIYRLYTLAMDVAPSSSAARDAKKKRDSGKRQYEKACDEVMKNLDKEAKVLAKAERYGEAADLYGKYEGTCAAGTAARRERCEKSMREKQEWLERRMMDKQKAEEEIREKKAAAKAAAEREEFITKELYTAVEKKGVLFAKTEVDKFTASDPGIVERPKLAEICKIIVDADKSWANVVKSFKDAEGTEISLHTDKLPVTAVLDKFDEDTGILYLRRPAGADWLKIEVSASELSLYEMLPRTGNTISRGNRLMRAIICLHHKDIISAKEEANSLPDEFRKIVLKSIPDKSHGKKPKFQ